MHCSLQSRDTKEILLHTDQNSNEIIQMQTAPLFHVVRQRCAKKGSSDGWVIAGLEDCCNLMEKHKRRFVKVLTLLEIIIIIIIITKTIFIQANLFSKMNLLLSTKDM